jgi:hypothetical protein
MAKKFTREYFQQWGAKGGAIGGKKGGTSKSPKKLKALAKARRILKAKRRAAKKGR